ALARPAGERGSWLAARGCALPRRSGRCESPWRCAESCGEWSRDGPCRTVGFGWGSGSWSCCGSCSCGLLALLGCGPPRPNRDGRIGPGTPPSCPEETAQIGPPSGPLGLGAKGVDHVRLPSLGGPASLAGVRLCPRLEGPPALLAPGTDHAR